MVTIVGIAAVFIIGFVAYLAWGTGAAGSRKFNKTNVQHASSGSSPREESRSPGLD